MTQWWTYRLTNFLMFSPDVYWRLVQRSNERWWPAQVLGVAAVLGLAWLAWRGRGRAALVLLAIAWTWMAWAWHWRSYAEIFIAAPAIAVAGWVEALLLLAGCALPAREVAEPPTPYAIAWILLAAAALYSLLAPLTGHAWSEAEVFGFMPEPTALGTVGALVALRDRPRWSRVVLAIVPVLSLALGAATRWLIAR
jgi:hypothetical protein